MSMTLAEIEEQARKLPAEDRARLAEILWESLEDESVDDLPVPEWQLQIVQERIAEYRRDPTKVRSAYHIIDELRQRSR
jgi:putative addiction module component